MNKIRLTLKALSLIIFTLALASIAQAQLTRTFVSGVGNDADPCSRTAPCRTFAGAFPKTFINGEISVLDPGGYGTLTATKSITVDGTGGYGSSLASSATGVIVNLTDVSGNDPLHVVRLNNLNFNGAGAIGTVGTRTGLDGIRVLTGSGVDPTVIVENTVIDGFTQSGIDWVSNGGHLLVKNCTIRNNSQHGIFVDSGGANLVRVSIDNTTADFNQEGIRFDDNVRGTITRSRASNNTLNGFTCFPQGTGSSEMYIDHSTSSGNLQWGAVAAGTGATTGLIVISDNVITNNVVSGLQINAGGTINSSGRNRITAPTMAPGGFVEQ